jgi:hypothetical protein
MEKWLDSVTEEWVDSGTNYILGLIHDDGDRDFIPEHVQQEIHNFAEKTFIPALLKYLKNSIPLIDGISFSDFNLIAEDRGLLENTFNDEQQYDL